MYNLCLPMKVIFISQRSGSSYSHPNGALDLAGSDGGIDFAYAIGYWRCVAFPWGYNTAFFVSCDENGNDALVHCADGEDRIVTIAMTHGGFKYSAAPVVGKVYKDGEIIYEEGMVGKPGQITGNHIHFEVAQGVQTTKYKDESMGVYRMKNELKPEDVCFICDSFSTVANMGGAIMAHCMGREAEGEPDFKLCDGYQELEYNAQNIKAYKQSGNEKIAIVSCPYGQVLDIGDFTLPGKRIKAIVNANYFIMGGSGGYLGRVQGFQNGTKDYIDARPASPAETGQVGDKPFMDLVLTKDGKISFGDFNSWDYPINEVTFGTSPAGVEIANGKIVNKYSPECGYGKITTPNTQTMLIRCPDGKFALAVVNGKLSPIPDLQQWGTQYKFDHLSVYDSGGSTQMIVNGEKKMYTGRKIPVCFVIYEDEDVPPVPVADPIGVIHLVYSGMNIRNAIRGEIISTAKKGEKVNLIRFIDDIQSDGYQWAVVEYNRLTGYAQLDTSVMWIELM